MLVTGVRFPVCATGGELSVQNRRQGLAYTLLFEQPFTVSQQLKRHAKSAPTRVQSDFWIFHAETAHQDQQHQSRSRFRQQSRAKQQTGQQHHTKQAHFVL